MNQQKRTGKMESEENEPKAPAQVIYCGPSNKAVDVVTGKSCFCNIQRDQFYLHYVIIEQPEPVEITHILIKGTQ